MQVILLEKVGKLGNIGAVTEVKDGYARNFLIPRKKALRATKANIAYFEAEKAEIERINAEKKATAEAALNKFEGLRLTIVRQAGEDGKLYGSVSGADIAKAIAAKIGDVVDAEHILTAHKLKEIGIHQVEIALHPEVKTTIELAISRSEDQVHHAV